LEQALSARGHIIVDVTQHAALMDDTAPRKRGAAMGLRPQSDAGVTENGMANYEMTGHKSPGTERAPTAREATLSWAEQQSRIQARATRALVSIRQAHLSYYDR